MTNSMIRNSTTTIMLTSFLLGASCTLALTMFLDKKKKSSNRKKKRSTTTNTNDNNTSSSTTNKSSSSSNNEENNNNITTSTATTIPTHLRQEQLSRHELYFGHDNLQAIRNSKVCIVGLGGVGSHTAIMLARGGIEKKLRLIDFDQVTLSSLNRHACATLQDVGIPKVICVQKTCHALGVTNVDAIVEMYTMENGHALLNINDGEEKWDYVIDCIDDVPTKAALLAHCISQNIRVLSCMGAGGKSDMTRLHISDLRTAAKDPLASKLRQTLKKQMKQIQQQQQQATTTSNTTTTNTNDDSYLDDMDRLTIIYSSEKPVVKLADLTPEQEQEKQQQQSQSSFLGDTFGAVDGMRIRILPVLGPMPAIMGQSLASIALCELGKKSIHQPVTGERIGRNVRNKMYQHLKSREIKIASGKLTIKYDGNENGGEMLVQQLSQQQDEDNKDNNNNNDNNNNDGTLNSNFSSIIEIDMDDVDYLMGVWRNRCAVTGARQGTVLELIRWDLSKPATIDNLVLMSTHAIKAMDEQGKSVYVPKHIQQRIEERLANCRDLNCDV